VNDEGPTKTIDILTLHMGMIPVSSWLIYLIYP
jgi:hypothetical protein